MLVQEINADQTTLQAYLALRRQIRSQPRTEREQYVKMQPIITALKEVLRGEWAWERLIGPSGHSKPVANENAHAE